MRAVDPSKVEEEALAEIDAASTPAELEEARLKYLGRKAALKLALREVRDRDHGESR